MHHVYILKCKDNTFYSGLTENIKNRIHQHNNGSVSYTANRLPIKLIWVGVFKNKDKAANFEQYLKTGSGNAFFKKHLI